MTDLTHRVTILGRAGERMIFLTDEEGYEALKEIHHFAVETDLLTYPIENTVVEYQFPEGEGQIRWKDVTSITKNPFKEN